MLSLCTVPVRVVTTGNTVGAGAMFPAILRVLNRPNRWKLLAPEGIQQLHLQNNWPLRFFSQRKKDDSGRPYF
jgi:hypothetical protein